MKLTPVTADDVDVLYRIWTDPHVRRYLWDDTIIDRETAQQVVEQSVNDWAAQRYGLWLISKNEETIGFAGLRSSADTNEPELLFGILSSHWHRGIATAASNAALHHAFDELEQRAVWAATDAPNVASMRVLERIGMTLDRREELQGRDTMFYRITAAAYHARTEDR